MDRAEFHCRQKTGGRGSRFPGSNATCAVAQEAQVNFLRDILIFVIRIYQRTVSPLLVAFFGPMSGCRYTPSCSQFAIEALKTHGPISGTWLAIKRICRCHPFGGCGHDPVPPNLNSISRSI
ncbi:MAG: membrane protein insertion efficiency factor YidD [Verrucomicrobia bacterium]|nr:membrane protein insertion efficiency factor YidD [Verrucomicrobiota bacterium]